MLGKIHTFHSIGTNNMDLFEKKGKIQEIVRI